MGERIMQNVTLCSLAPIFGDNYRPGYIGFTYHTDSLVLSPGIAYFTRWARMSDIKVSHALIVSGEDECIQAHRKGGVHRAPLGPLFEDRQCQIFFRKPRGWTGEIGARIVETVAEQVGTKYDTPLIVAQALQGTFLGKLINKAFKGKPDAFVSRLLNDPEEWICSELAAYGLDEQPEYRDLGILAKPNETIDPQELFEDPIIFAPWKCGPALGAA